MLKNKPADTERRDRPQTQHFRQSSWVATQIVDSGQSSMSRASACLVVLLWSVAGAARAQAPANMLPPIAPPPATEAAPTMLSLEAAINWALENNPELAALRQQHGIAAAAVVIAQTYPFNPIWEAKVRAANGPESAGITNRVSNEHKVLIDVEVHHQGKYRREGATAALSRTDWEIAFQELALAIRVARAFDGLIYRKEKLRLLEATVRLNEEAADQVQKLAEAGRLRPADLIVARTEVDDARAQLSPGRLALTGARAEFRRSLGLVEEGLEPLGALEDPAAKLDDGRLLRTAFETRADLRARQMAVAEADARLRLTQADRYGNPNIGPAYEYDPTRINLIGVQFTLPLPVFNTHRGEIMQREAELARAGLDLRQTEVQIQQEVHAAQARLQAAQEGLRSYQQQILPNLEKNFKAMDELFRKADPGADLLRLIDIRRKMLKARDGYLDALWENRQAEADLAAAVGDPSLAVGRAQPK
jgi:cobalt-zinc-cadmium efflux system outer membrane protein